MSLYLSCEVSKISAAVVSPTDMSLAQPTVEEKEASLSDSGRQVKNLSIVLLCLINKSNF